ncbi:response regulator transcription factor [Microvirga sp. BSC39]|uniref:response regulator n=1 Tax=Microvirga sp. BSC39 TaxID=1549810 RepID=UPI00068DE729|nr:response regulator transcription factor [Microvirga sp. BSC39]
MNRQDARTSLVVADDHPLVLQGLEGIIAPEPDLHIVSLCANGLMTLEAIHKYEPDIALLDVAMPTMSGVEVLDALTRTGSTTKVIFLSATMSDTQIYAAVEKGAYGVVLKDVAPHSLLDCLRRVGSGGRWFPPESVGEPIQREIGRRQAATTIASLLTSREREILLLVGYEFSNKEIARRLCISDGTVKLHIHKIYQKLGTSRRSDIEALAASYGDILGGN